MRRLCLEWISVFPCPNCGTQVSASWDGDTIRQEFEKNETKLRAENERLREALEQFADPTNWQRMSHEYIGDYALWVGVPETDTPWTIARAALDGGE